MNRLRVEEVILVEGKYDAVKLADLVDGLILTTNGFSIFHNEDAKRLILELGKKRGIIVLTDSDAAGFRIRNHINQFARGITVKNAYVPAIAGKEPRKAAPSKEGLLGVEGVPAEAIRTALRTAGAHERAARAGRAITYADLYEWGLSGTAGSAGTRRAWLQSIGLPPRLSKKALCEVLNSLYTYEELKQLLPPQGETAAAENGMEKTRVDCNGKEERNMTELKPAYGFPAEVRMLFAEYTQMLVRGEPSFGAYLDLQQYGEEIDHLKEKYGPPAGRLYLAFCGGEPAGCIGLHQLDAQSCEMKRLYVRPRFRGKGIGGMLVRKVIEDAKEIGYRQMFLDTLPFLQSALKLYKSCGFCETERYNDSPVESSIFMKLEL